MFYNMIVKNAVKKFGAPCSDAHREDCLMAGSSLAESVLRISLLSGAGEV